jgi:hypothetical protein
VTTKAKITIREYRSGVRARVRCNEGCAMQFELLGSLRGKRLTALGDVLLANRVFTRRTKLRDVVILRRVGLVDTANRFTVRLRVTTTDRSGNRRVTIKRIIVG